MYLVGYSLRVEMFPTRDSVATLVDSKAVRQRGFHRVVLRVRYVGLFTTLEFSLEVVDGGRNYRAVLRTELFLFPNLLFATIRGHEEFC